MVNEPKEKENERGRQRKSVPERAAARESGAAKGKKKLLKEAAEVIQVRVEV